MWFQAEIVTICWTVAVWGCLCISCLQHVSLILHRPVRSTAFGTDKSALQATVAVIILGWGGRFSFLTPSSIGTLCRQGKGMTYLSSIHGFSPCISSNVWLWPGILSYRLHNWSWSLRCPLCTWTLKLLGHRGRFWCALTFQQCRPLVSISQAKN